MLIYGILTKIQVVLIFTSIQMIYSVMGSFTLPIPLSILQIGFIAAVNMVVIPISIKTFPPIWIIASLEYIKPIRG